MKVYYGTDALPQWKNVVLTIGTFDGVHQGHKSILESVVREAKGISGTSILITFDPHPRKLIFPNKSLKLLSTLEEKLGLIAEAGIDVTVVVPFTMAFAARSAQDYIQDFLLRLFRPKLIVIGYDHHFGHDRTGDINMLQYYTDQHHYAVKEISAQLIADAAVSSTQVRKAIQSGDISIANRMLGWDYSIKGRVVYGTQLGRTIGYPTANIAHIDEDKILPKQGVYAVRVKLSGQLYGAMLNIGINPSITHDNQLKIEVHIFNFNQDIYNQEISIQFIERLRDEQKFNTLDGLKEQLAIDQKKANSVLES
ncbi:MAG: bifunctional riboflavin kinase/FAD synthetase [Phycisphaerales bacterium]|nr:bifunctional riboflavin kinase/FAD synthetase [Phycisphaerales bacterium]